MYVHMYKIMQILNQYVIVSLRITVPYTHINYVDTNQLTQQVTTSAVDQQQPSMKCTYVITGMYLVVIVIN